MIHSQLVSILNSNPKQILQGRLRKGYRKDQIYGDWLSICLWKTCWWFTISLYDL